MIISALYYQMISSTFDKPPATSAPRILVANPLPLEDPSLLHYSRFPHGWCYHHPQDCFSLPAFFVLLHAFRLQPAVPIRGGPLTILVPFLGHLHCHATYHCSYHSTLLDNPLFHGPLASTAQCLPWAPVLPFLVTTFLLPTSP